MDVPTCARTPAPGHTSAASKTIYARTHIDISGKRGNQLKRILKSFLYVVHRIFIFQRAKKKLTLNCYKINIWHVIRHLLDKCIYIEFELFNVYIEKCVPNAIY